MTRQTNLAVFLSSAHAACIKFLFFLITLMWSLPGQAQPGRFSEIIFGSGTGNPDDFEQFVARAKKAGATHIQINAEDLPLAYWEMTPPGDPYPAWVISNPGILKTFTPGALRQYIPQETAEQVIRILEERCKILRKHGLKAQFHTFEPQMLPEVVFEDHPAWRGPQVDHPMRSKTPRFAPSVDHPEVLKLYEEAMKIFISRCPEVEILVFRTSDSGAGFDWGRLYYGSNGNTNYKDRSMQGRIKGFLSALQRGAAAAGSELAVHVYNSRENAKAFAKGFDEGMAIDGFEGPGATPFSADVDALLYYKKSFAPVAGIPRPVDFLEKLERAWQTPAPRLSVSLIDADNADLYLKICHAFQESPTHGVIDRLQLLRSLAETEVGLAHGEKLFNLWLSLDAAQKAADLLNTGGTIFNLGTVQQRWLVRPLVPFPAELRQDEKDYYRKHQFSAGSEEEADNLLIVQGARVYLGEGGNRFINVLLNKTQWQAREAGWMATELSAVLSGNQKQQFELLAARLQAFDCLVANALNVANYQHRLDLIEQARQQAKEGKLAQNFDLSARSAMIETARNEIDNTARLIRLFESVQPNSLIIDHAKTAEEEYVRLLGTDLIGQLRRKIRTMNAHWQDYNRIFAVQNL